MPKSDEIKIEQCWTSQAYAPEDQKTLSSQQHADACAAELCLDGSHGIMCGSCVDTFTFNSALGLCVKCSSSANITPIVVVAGITLLACAFLVLQYRGVQIIPPWFFQLALVRVLKNVDKGMLKVGTLAAAMPFILSQYLDD